MSEPAGLDQFIADSGNPGPVSGSPDVSMGAPQNGEPQGLDQFIAPELNEEKYGGLTGEFATAGLGALSGATLGASNLALTKSGLISPETLKGYQETNPKSNFAGELAGTVGSMIAAPELSPAALIGKAGKAVQVATSGEKALNVAGAAMEALGLSGNAKAAKILASASDLGSHALGSAVEGALYAGLGNTMNEYAIGDPSLNGEKLASVIGHNLGQGALYGGVLGTAFRGASTVLPESLGAAKKSFIAAKDAIIGTGTESGGLLSKGLDTMDSSGRLGDLWANRVANMDPDAKTKVIQKVTGSLNDLIRNTKSTIKDFNSRIRPQAVDALIDTADKDAVLQGQQGVIDKTLSTIDEIKNNPGLYDQNAAAKLEKYHSQLVGDLKGGNNPADIFERVRDVQQKIADWGRGVAANAQTADTKALLTELSGHINSYLKDPDVFGLVGSNLAEHNSMLAKIYNFLPAFEKKSQFTTDWMANVGTTKSPKWEFDPKKVERIFKSGDQVKIDRLNDFFDTMKQFPEHIENTAAAIPNEGMDSKLLDQIQNARDTVIKGKEDLQNVLDTKKGRLLGIRDFVAASVAHIHPVLGATLELYNLGSRPLEAINKLAEVEHLVNQATNQLSKATKAVFNPSVKAATFLRGKISADLVRNNTEQYRKESDNIAEMANNPQLMIDKVSKATEDLHSVAADTAQSLQMSTIRAAQFLASKSPIQPETNPFAPKFVPSVSAMAKYQHYKQIVEDPLSALQEVSELTIGPTTIETLSAVYPTLYDEMKKNLLQEAMNKVRRGESIPYQKKQAISTFLQTPLDSSMSFLAMSSNQAAFAQEHQEKAQMNQLATKPSKAGMQKLTVASRTGLGHHDDNV